MEHIHLHQAWNFFSTIRGEMAILYPVEVLPIVVGSSVATMTRKYTMLNLQEIERTHTHVRACTHAELLLQFSLVTDMFFCVWFCFLFVRLFIPPPPKQQNVICIYVKVFVMLALMWSTYE
jgi:L-asparagine transporter-like permease